jgi:cytochrome subunit of sulfide dehydrogenase
VGAAKPRDDSGRVWKALVAAVAFASLAVAAVASAEPPPGAAACTGCHPASARVTSPVLRLNGLDQAAIVKAMQDFRAGRRVATVMDRIAKGFTDEEIQAIAAWYAAQR